MTWKPFNPADYDVGAPLFVSSSFGGRSADEYTVTHKTPGGQIVAVRNNHTIRVNKRGRIVGIDRWDRRTILSAERAAELIVERSERERFLGVKALAEGVYKAAARADIADLQEAFAKLASAMSAFGQDPQGLEAKPASAVPKADAQ